MLWTLSQYRWIKCCCYLALWEQGHYVQCRHWHAYSPGLGYHFVQLGVSNLSLPLEPTP